MGVYIKDVEMPKNCAECRFCVNGFADNAPMYECACQSYDNVSVLIDDHGQPFDFRPEWCPLIEVPIPHGRLMDADELYGAIVDKGQRNERGKYRIGEYWELTGREIREVINGQSSIIEAEGET